MYTLNSLLDSSLTTIAQAAAPGAGGLGQFLPFIFIFAGMWFLIIAPQRKKQKKHEQMMKELTAGDQIMTTGGMFGTIMSVKEDRFVVKVSDNTRIELGKNFISSKIEKSEDSSDK